MFSAPPHTRAQQGALASRTATLLALWLMVGCGSRDRMVGDAGAPFDASAVTTSKSRSGPRDLAADADADADADAASPSDANVDHSQGGSGGSSGSTAHDRSASMPQMGAAGSSGAAGAANGQAGAPSSNTDAGPASPPDMTPIDSDEIESVSFDEALNGNPTPVLLFRGGYACWDRQLTVSMPIDASAHRTQFPEQWSTWRRGRDRIEVKRANGWVPLPFGVEFAPLPKGTRLSGLYEYVFVLDPTSEYLVLQSTRYRFNEDGTFEYCYSSTITGPSVFRSERTPRIGRYEIEGYTVQLADNAGVTNFQPLFHSSEYANELWVGDVYLRTSTLSEQEVCD